MPVADTALYTAAQVRELDRRVIEEHGVPGFDLMHRAAQAAFDCLRYQWPHARRLVIFCGPGNNGGDGFLIGQLALAAQLEVSLFLLGERERVKGDARLALEAFEQTGGKLHAFSAGTRIAGDVVVDALLGTGLQREVEGDFLAAVNAMNDAGADGAGIMAADIPSGLDANTGKIWGAAVKAQVTATFIGRKLGLHTGAGPACAGRVSFHSLNAPDAIYSNIGPCARVITPAELRDTLPPRPADAHKGGHGHVLCIGGNHGMSGAVRMMAQAALRVGAGLVSVATRQAHAPVITQAQPELMCRGVETGAELDLLTKAAGCAAIGPGLGQDCWAQALFSRVLESKLPLVVDADALNLLACEPIARDNWILTPHPGEAARLLDTDTAAVQADRPAAVKEMVTRYNAVVVLKGAGSLVQAPGGELMLCEAGNPGMASGGMGDVLTGVIAGLVAQGLNQRLNLETAASTGVLLHATAGDDAARAGGQRGLLATDLLPYLRRAANPE